MSQGFLFRLPPELRWCLGMLLFVCLASPVGALLGSLIEMPGAGPAKPPVPRARGRAD